MENIKYNYNDIVKVENEYNRSLNSYTDHLVKYRNFFRLVLKIGKGSDLDEDVAKSEINKFMTLISSDDFYNKYGRKFNIVDLYLATNLTPLDLCGDYIKYMDKDEIRESLLFIKRTLLEVDNIKVFGHKYRTSQKASFMCRFYSPSKNSIKDLLDIDFKYFNKLENVSINDANEAHKILLDLNDKYGVKYDDVSLYIILRSYLNGEIESYYRVAEDYKTELDKYTHVQKRCIPLLTRREKNEEI